MRLLALSVLTGLGVLSASSALAATSTPQQPPASVGAGVNVALPSNVKSAHFVDQNGNAETLGALSGKTIFLVPYLTLCGDTCPFTTGDMLQLQDLLNKAHASQVEVVGIDVDPFRDTQTRVAAYVKLIGANFQLWREAGSTATPTLTRTELASKNPVGTGDTNPNLTAIEKFFGWTVQVVPQGTPAATDWMTPHKKLTYDINHSDGFWVINAHQVVRFASGDLPSFTGKLSKTLATFMGDQNNIYKDVNRGGWTPAEALQAISWAIGRRL